MNKKFKMPLKATSKGFYLEFTHLEDGWEIMNPPFIGGKCNTYGKSQDKDVLHECLVQDGAYSYPNNLCNIIKRMWDKIKEGEDEKITKKKFEKLGKIIEKCCLDIDEIENITL